MAQGERPGPGEVARLTQVFAAMGDRFGPAARAKHQRLIVSPPEPVEVALSGVQLEQVLGNLLDNAIKFTQAHGENPACARTSRTAGSLFTCWIRGRASRSRCARTSARWASGATTPSRARGWAYRTCASW